MYSISPELYPKLPITTFRRIVGQNFIYYRYHILYIYLYICMFIGQNSINYRYYVFVYLCTSHSWVSIGNLRRSILQALSTLEMMISGFSGLVRDPRDSSHHRHIVFSILRTITVSLCESYTKPEE